MRARVLVTGLNGFTGPYVKQELERRGLEVCGLGSSAVAGRSESIDLLDGEALAHELAARPADYVIHLAGVSVVVHDRLLDYYRVNIEGTLNLLEAITRQGRKVKKVLLASSANVYGRPINSPVNEDAPTLPVSHYGASKLGMELMARIWFEQMPILLVRPFNYTGIGQSMRFVVAKLARLFREKALNIEMGDTSVFREFMDVRDVVRVYADLLECDHACDVVNLCSGVGHSVDEIFEMLTRISGHSPKLVSKAELRRSNDIRALIGSTSKLTSFLGAGVSFRPVEETLRWMLEGRGD
jgi:nucleoside-diphosphate-sugar epimerase